ncbi:MULTISPECIES: hypothetical protein [unclassified Bradyrhizobium]|uniref:hypothetical protein n=1 Tax=unclassified Bradyrhizobium TaxID=2631580 RepID=UPI001FF9A5AB|nr:MULTISPECIES: hypothetical protein [unclassified Bradyrhizobium]
MALEIGENFTSANPCTRDIRPGQQRLVVRGKCVVVPPEIPECVASTKPCSLQVRPDRQRLVVGDEGILETSELFKAAALACVGIGKVRIVECRLVELLNRFAIASRELGQDRTSVVIRKGIARIHRQCAREIGQGFLRPIQRFERISIIAEGLVAASVQGHGRPEMHLGLRKSTLYELHHAQEMFDFEDVPGGFCDLLQYSFRFDQIMGVKGFDSTSKFGLQFTRQVHSSLGTSVNHTIGPDIAR